MPKRRTRKSPPQRNSVTGSGIPRPSLFIQLAIIAACAAAGWVAWLDYRIHAEFEGRRWTIPARVYGRPLEIYPGRALTAGCPSPIVRRMNGRFRIFGICREIIR